MYLILFCAICLSTTTVAVVQNNLQQDSTDNARLTCHREGYQYAPSTGKCYKYHTETKNWDEAEEACIAEGGHLLVINDVNEAETIQHLFRSRRYLVYVGLRDRSQAEGYWKSVDGIPVEKLYNVWNDGYKPEILRYRCGYLRMNGKINNVNCDYNTSFICENHPD